MATPIHGEKLPGQGGPIGSWSPAQLQGFILHLLRVQPSMLPPTLKVNTLHAVEQLQTDDASKAGFFGAEPITKPTVTGSTGANAALQSLLAALADLGLITDETT